MTAGLNYPLAMQDETNEADDQPIVDETADVPVENGPWEDDVDYFENYQY